MNHCSNCGRPLKDTDLVCPYCTTDLNETPEHYKYVKDTIPDEITEHNSVSGLLRTLGSIIWGLTFVSAVLMLIIGIVGSLDKDSSLMIAGSTTGLTNALLITLTGTISGALLKGFAELLDVVDDINRKLSRK